MPNLLKRKGKEDTLKLMAWSPQSPDLNLIELVWNEQKDEFDLKQKDQVKAADQGTTPVDDVSGAFKII